MMMYHVTMCHNLMAISTNILTINYGLRGDGIHICRIDALRMDKYKL